MACESGGRSLVVLGALGVQLLTSHPGPRSAVHVVVNTSWGLRISSYPRVSPGIPPYPAISRHIPPYPAADTAKRIGQTRDRYRRAAVPPLLSYSLPLPPCRLSRRPMPCLPSVAAAPPYRRPLPPYFLLDRVCADERTEPPGAPQRPRWARRTGPRVLRSNLAEPERRLARWGASMRPTQVVVLLLQASA